MGPDLSSPALDNPPRYGLSLKTSIRLSRALKVRFGLTRRRRTWCGRKPLPFTLGSLTISSVVWSTRTL